MNIKAKIGKHIVDLLPKTGIIAFGSGSTVNACIEQMGKRLSEFSDLRFVSGSSLTSQVMLRYGLMEVKSSTIDICIDGADQVLNTTPYHILKGRGGALFQEKVLWKLAKKIIVGITDNKNVNSFTQKIPVEVVPIALDYCFEELQKLLPESNIELRVNPDGFNFITDNGNVILDIINYKVKDFSSLQTLIKGITGVVETGLFTEKFSSINCVIGNSENIEVFHLY